MRESSPNASRNQRGSSVVSYHVELALHITASGAFQKSVLGSVEVLGTYPVQLTVKILYSLTKLRGSKDFCKCLYPKDDFIILLDISLEVKSIGKLLIASLQ